MKPYENLKREVAYPFYLFGRILLLLVHITTLLLMFYGMDVLEDKQKNIVEYTLYSFGYLAIVLNGLLLLFHVMDAWLSVHDPFADEHSTE